MYLGRIISAGKTEDGKPYVAYRVSSRSFPNRQVKVLEDEAAIIPKEGFETDIFKNSYIAYDCVKVLDDIAVISNGSQTNPIADKIAIGMNIRDAMAYSLITLDYEKDDYNINASSLQNITLIPKYNKWFPNRSFYEWGKSWYIQL